MPSRLSPGDLVHRKYHISRARLDPMGLKELGLVLCRDNNGFLDVLWGSKIESMWDEYDLLRVEGRGDG